MSTEWMVEEHEPGWLGRLIAPSGGGRPATAAVVIGVLAAVAFALSLSFNWGTVTLDEGPFEGQAQYEAGVSNMFSLSLGYMIGVVALLGIVGAVVTMPELALKLRLAAIGVTAGVVAIVIAATVQLPTVATLGYPGQIEPKAAIQVGLFFGYAAAVLPLAAIWLAARPAAQPPPPPPPPPPAPAELADEDEPPAVPFPRGLSVSGGPVDLTVTPG
jgi:hypothetical protein